MKVFELDLVLQYNLQREMASRPCHLDRLPLMALKFIMPLKVIMIGM